MNQYLVSARRQELDWLRVFAVLLLVYYHTGMLFSPWAWYVKNQEISENYAYWMAFFHAWRMPLLFFISGAGTYFAFGKRNTLQFVVERAKRLIVPLIFGMIVILPPQVYYEYIQHYDNYWDFYRSVSNYISFEEGVPRLHNLWFIAHLFMYSMVGIPVIIFLRSAHVESLKTRLLDFLFKPIVFLLFPPVLVLLTQMIFIPDHLGRAHFAFYFSFFLAGMISYSSSVHTKTIGKHRKFFLFASILSLIPHTILYQGQAQIYPFESHNFYSLLEQTAIFACWFLVITIIGYAQHYLNYARPWLARVSEAAYPVYIIHQTVIVIIGYYMCKLPWGISLKFWVISSLTIAISVALFELVIRPFNVVRFLFGLKVKQSNSKVVVA